MKFQRNIIDASKHFIARPGVFGLRIASWVSKQQNKYAVSVALYLKCKAPLWPHQINLSLKAQISQEAAMNCMHPALWIQSDFKGGWPLQSHSAVHPVTRARRG